MPYDEIHEKKIEELAATLRKNIEGEVRFSDGDRALYATDGSNYRQPPIGVVIPKSEEDVITTVKICRQFDVPILPRGCGTSLAGQCCNVAVVIDFSKYLNKILEINSSQKLARVQPGCILDNLKNEAKKHRLTFAPDPSTHSHNTLGGMIGNNSCGTHSLMAVNEGNGLRTADNIEALKILTYDGQILQVGKTSENQLESYIAQGGRMGEIYQKLKSLRDRYANLIRERFPDIPRRVSGYTLEQLLPEHGFHLARALVGSEGTCVTILEATTNLVYCPSIRILLVLGYPDVFSCGDHLLEILQHKPCAVEGFDTLLIEDMKAKELYTHYLHLLPPGGGWLLVEFDGDTLEEADQKAQQLMAEMCKKENPPSMKLYEEDAVVKAMWKVRESGLGATAWIPGQADTWEGWEDAAVAPDKLGIYLRELRKLFKKYNYKSSTYGHFGQGCVHCRIPFDLKTDEGIKNFRSFLDEAADLVISLGGSLSGEHGDGQSRAELLPKMYGEELVNAFREFKSIWDPHWKMNPGKIVDPYPITSNLRLGKDYNPWNPQTHFQYPQDRGSFARATLRCVGVGICRRESGGIMCPSFMVTKEEKYSTRGRAHLLFEMLERKVIGKHGWRDHAVRESLGLCLSCKGCKSDCPVNVDMAKYKAEFLSHYYAGKLRAISSYIFGFIFIWARFASQFPKFINFLTQTPGLSHLSKLMVGMAQKRRIPRFANQTFRDWYLNHHVEENHREKIILWVDTFTNYFEPGIPIAATEVLEKLGFQVIVPLKELCCGRPLYDFGFLKPAKKLLLDILNNLRSEIRDGIPIVGLEPSCVATFRDEMTDLLPHDEDALRLKKQTFLLSEFLVKKNKLENLPSLAQRALVQIHCHHHAVMKMDAEQIIMKKLGLEFDILNAGCCGMAGSFGYEKGEKYEVSVKAAERELAPAIRKVSAETLIIADGFSCRTQIYDQTGRKALHLAEVIKMAIDNKNK